MSTVASIATVATAATYAAVSQFLRIIVRDACVSFCSGCTVPTVTATTAATAIEYEKRIHFVLQNVAYESYSTVASVSTGGPISTGTNTVISSRSCCTDTTSYYQLSGTVKNKGRGRRVDSHRCLMSLNIVTGAHRYELNITAIDIDTAICLVSVQSDDQLLLGRLDSHSD